MDPDYALFAAVIEHGSISAAARVLRLSPAMASRRLARLEGRLGARLIHRTTRRQSPTEAGQQFYARIVQILAAAREAEEMVSRGAIQPAGALRITAPTSFGRLHVAPHLAGFLCAYPKIAVRLDLTDEYVDLIERRYDLAIRIAAQVDASMVGFRIASNRRVLCASPAYLQRHGEPGSLAELKRHQLLAADGQLPWRLEGPEGPALVTADSLVATNSSEVVRELAVAGAGVALRSTWDIFSELRSGALQIVLPPYRGAADFAIFAVHPAPTITSAAVRAFVEYLQGLYGPEPPWERR